MRTFSARATLIALLNLPLLLLCGCSTSHVAGQRFEYTQPQMGVPFRIVLYAPMKSGADAAARAAYARVSQLNSIMSDYDTDSELSRLSQTAGQGMAVPVSDDLWHVLTRAQALAKKTGGAFDVTCGPVVSLWRKARRQHALPAADKLGEARLRVGADKLRLNESQHTAELLVPYMRLDLGAIAKGYAADEALKVLRAHGVTRALAGGGGDLAIGDAPPGRKGWRIELAPLEATNAAPREFVLLNNCALATSGDLFQFVEIDGVRYSHIVDPRTGVGLTNHALVVVIARDCLTADSLSTAVSVLGPRKGLSLAVAEDACARIVRPAGSHIERRETKCFRRLVRSPVAALEPRHPFLERK